MGRAARPHPRRSTRGAASRLTTEKFDLDGPHTGTGGGNHITLGGSQPIESPLLRRPDLLASLITYWQRHPSLSYLFSGRFIGPTSQAPRFDEGRPEAVYEMEIALQEIRRLTDAARAAASLLPWVVDRSLRHLLTDLTGNTHRAEFCIDKLYSPDSSRGRLGLLELRGFEMPPHAELALVQALLVRSLVAMFWEKPLHRAADPLGHAPARGLPAARGRDPRHRRGRRRPARARHRLRGDLARRVHRVPLPADRDDADRRPVPDRIELELRHAIEPWNVLGEEATAGGTARYVDSSVERVQVKVRGIDPAQPPRHVQPGARAARPRRAAPASTTPACGTARGSRGRRCIRRSRSTRRSPST